MYERIEKRMPSLNNLYLEWDEDGGFWFTAWGDEYTPADMIANAAALEVECQKLKSERARMGYAFRDFVNAWEKIASFYPTLDA